MTQCGTYCLDTLAKPPPGDNVQRVGGHWGWRNTMSRDQVGMGRQDRSCD